MYCEGCGQVVGEKHECQGTLGYCMSCRQPRKELTYCRGCVGVFDAVVNAARRLHEAAAQPDSPLRHSSEAHAMYQALLDLDRLWIKAHGHGPKCAGCGKAFIENEAKETAAAGVMCLNCFAKTPEAAELRKLLEDPPPKG